jgi:hypothetical protein
MGCLLACLSLSAAGLAKSWRNLEPIPAAAITWKKGFIGTVGQDRTRLYHLTGRGGLGFPFLSSGPSEEELDARAAYIDKWLAKHPKAMAVPVEAYPFFSKTIARIYIWIVDGPAHLNLDLVREGFIEGSALMTNLRIEDLYITGKQLWAFRDQAAQAEIEAAEAGKGIWKDAEPRYPPGKLEYPSFEELARFERAAESMADPPPDVDAGKENDAPN